MRLFEAALLICLILCALGTTIAKNLLISVIIFTAYSIVMAVVWLLLKAPDLAVTEAAVGAGVTGILFFLTLKKVNAIKGTREK